MKINISYKQRRSLNVYTFIRVIDFTPDNRFFKDKVEQKICSRLKLGNREYVEEVKRVLEYSGEDIIHEIESVIEERMMNPSELYVEINEYNKEIGISSL